MTVSLTSVLAGLPQGHEEVLAQQAREASEDGRRHRIPRFPDW